MAMRAVLPSRAGLWRDLRINPAWQHPLRPRRNTDRAGEKSCGYAAIVVDPKMILAGAKMIYRDFLDGAFGLAAQTLWAQTVWRKTAAGL